MSGEKVYSDCCDYCVRADDLKREVEPCTRMRSRCKGDSCAPCRPCTAFVAAPESNAARAIARRRERPTSGALMADFEEVI